MPKRIILHTGATKTGTSALQVGLAQNLDQLLAQGVYAPPGRRFEKNLEGLVSGGNAKQLKAFGRALRDGSRRVRRDPETRLRAWLEELVGSPAGQQAETIVLSGEAIPGSFDSAGFQQIKTILDEYFTETTCIYYVRHLCDHAISQYGEYVRRRRMKDTFSEFAPVYVAPFLEAITKMEQTFGRGNVTVLQFEAERAALWPNFVRLLGANPDDMRLPIEVNRSLCAEEILLIRDLNRLGITRTLLAKTLSNYSAAIGPATSNRLTPTPADIEAIAQTHAAQMDYINGLLPDGCQLKPASDSLFERARTHVPVETAELPFEHMRAMLVAALTTSDAVLSKQEESDDDD